MSTFSPSSLVKLKENYTSQDGKTIPKNTIGEIKREVKMELRTKWYEVEFEKYGTIRYIEHEKLELAART